MNTQPDTKKQETFWMQTLKVLKVVSYFLTIASAILLSVRIFEPETTGFIVWVFIVIDVVVETLMWIEPYRTERNERQRKLDKLWDDIAAGRVIVQQVNPQNPQQNP